MCDSGIDDFPAVDHATLRAGMKRAAELDLLVAVHAESEELTSATQRERCAGNSVRDYLDSRPVAAETRRRFASRDRSRARNRLPIAHCARELRARRRARRRSARPGCGRDLRDLSALSCFSPTKTWIRLGAVAKCAPPLAFARTSRMNFGARLGDVSDDRLRSFAFAVGDEGGDEFLRRSGAGFPAASIYFRCLIDASEKISHARDRQTNERGCRGTFSHFRKRVDSKSARTPISRWSICTTEDVVRRGGAALSASPHSLLGPQTPRPNRAHNFAGTNNLREWYVSQLAAWALCQTGTIALGRGWIGNSQRSFVVSATQDDSPWGDDHKPLAPLYKTVILSEAKDL